MDSIEIYFSAFKQMTAAGQQTKATFRVYAFILTSSGQSIIDVRKIRDFFSFCGGS